MTQMAFVERFVLGIRPHLGNFSDSQHNKWAADKTRANAGRNVVAIQLSEQTSVERVQEDAVERFMEAERAHDPKRVEEIETKYPVLTEDQLAWRRSREVRLTEKFENTMSLSADISGRRMASPRL